MSSSWTICGADDILWLIPSPKSTPRVFLLFAFLRLESPAPLSLPCEDPFVLIKMFRPELETLGARVGIGFTTWITQLTHKMLYL